MSSRRKPGLKAAEDGDPAAENGLPKENEGTSSDEPTHEQHVQSLLDVVQAGGRIGLHRWKPDYAAGYLDVVTLDPDGDIADLLQTVKNQWGGGRYTLRPITREGQFSRGATPIEIAGPSLHEMRPYINGKLPDIVPAPAPMPVQPIQMAPPPARPGTDPMTTLLGNMAQSHAAGRIDDLFKFQAQFAELAGRMHGQQQPQAQPNPLAQVREVFSLAKEMAKVINSGSSNTDSDGDGGDMSIDRMMNTMLTQKMMAGMTGGNPQPYPQQQYPQQYPQQQYPQQPYPPQQYPQPQPPQQPQPPTTQPAAAQPPSEPEFEPVSPEEVAERIEELAKADPSQATQFVQSIMQKLPPEVLATMNAPSPPVADDKPPPTYTADFPSTVAG